MIEVQQTLSAQKRDFAVREDNLKAREESLAKMNQGLRQSLHRFNKFLHENDKKRARAEKKTAEEREIKEKKQVEIERLRVELEAQTRVKEQKNAIVSRYVRYQEFLEQVSDASEDLKRSDMDEVLTRFETLRTAHADLVASGQAVELEMERLKAELSAYNKDKDVEILRCNNEVAVLQKRLEGCSISRLATQQQAELDDRTLKLEESADAQLRLACNNIYERVLSKTGINHAAPLSKMTNQLTIIKNFISDMVALTNEAEIKRALPGGGGGAAGEAQRGPSIKQQANQSSSTSTPPRK